MTEASEIAADSVVPDQSEEASADSPQSEIDSLNDGVESQDETEAKIGVSRKAHQDILLNRWYAIEQSTHQIAIGIHNARVDLAEIEDEYSFAEQHRAMTRALIEAVAKLHLLYAGIGVPDLRQQAEFDRASSTVIQSVPSIVSVTGEVLSSK